MGLRKRVVLGVVALVMVGGSVPEARADRGRHTAVTRAYAAPRLVTVMSFNACGAMCRHGEVDRTAANVTDAALRGGATAVLLQELCYRQYLRIRDGLATHG